MPKATFRIAERSVNRASNVIRRLGYFLLDRMLLPTACAQSPAAILDRCRLGDG